MILRGQRGMLSSSSRRRKEWFRRSEEDLLRNSDFCRDGLVVLTTVCELAIISYALSDERETQLVRPPSGRPLTASAFCEFCGSSSDQVPLPRLAALFDWLLALL